MTERSLDERIAELETRVAHLEKGPNLEKNPQQDEPAENLSGQVGYQGTSTLNGEVNWKIRYSVDSLMGLPTAGLAEVLAALGSPIRLEIVRVLLRGPANASELQAAVGLTSAGQLYHHVKALTSARVVDQPSRAEYRIAPSHVVPLLIMMLAAADTAGDL